MSSLARSVSIVAGGLVVVLASAAAPATAQSGEVWGPGQHFFLAGAGNVTGRASVDFQYGDADDEVYVGDLIDETGAFGGDGRDDVILRRGNTYVVRGTQEVPARVFSYGDVSDEVLVGDWDGDGTDTLTVRRGNTFFVTDDQSQPAATTVFSYGDADDEVLAGNWDGDTSAEDAPDALATDTLMVRRGNRYFVKNDLRTGVADFEFVFGDPDDEVLTGDWAVPPVFGDDPSTPAKETTHVIAAGQSGDYADQLAVRRGNVYFESEEVYLAEGATDVGLETERSYGYGDAEDAAFAAQLAWTYDLNGTPDTLYGDGLAVRR